MHLESHGANPWQVDANELCFGAGDSPGVTFSYIRRRWKTSGRHEGILPTPEGDQLVESVESAQRELVKDQQISLEVALELGVKILQQAYYKSETAKRTTVGPLRRRRRARASWDKWFPPTLQERDSAYRFENAGIEPRAGQVGARPVTPLPCS